LELPHTGYQAGLINKPIMCFSASVSFGAGALLLGTGIYAIKRTESTRMLAFASLPVLFGFQQLSEGILWLTFSKPELDSWHQISIYSIIIIAQVILPIWVPFAVRLMEPNKIRKKVLSYFMLLGGILSVYTLYCLLSYEVSALSEGRHIRYQLQFPHLVLRRGLIVLTAIVPIFLSSLKFMKLLGGVLLGSLILTAIFFVYAILSVWCFFAAILSVMVLVVVVYNKKNIGKARPDYYITPTRDFTQYTKDSEEKYWRKETKFDWHQNVRNNLEQHLENLDTVDFLKVTFKVLPMLIKTLELKIFQIQREQLPLDEDALKDIAECVPSDRNAIQQAISILSPLKSHQLSVSKKRDQLEILSNDFLDLSEQNRLGLVREGTMVKHLETETEREKQTLRLSQLTADINRIQKEIKELEAQSKIESERLTTKIRSEVNLIESQVLVDLEASREMLQMIMQSKNLPKDPKDLSRLKNLILKRQLRGLKDICNHALVVEQSAIAPLTLGIIHYKRHREIQEAMTTFINDEAKHSATFRRYLAEKLEAREYISANLIKGAEHYMWLARLMPGAGMFLAVLVEAIGAAFLEFFGNEDYMPDSLFYSICHTISVQDERRHMDLCVAMYNELYWKGHRWERIRNHLALKVIMKSVYGDKSEDHPLIQAFSAFGVDSNTLYKHIAGRLSEQLVRINMYIEPERLLEFIDNK
jgi:hypothetical protein